MVFRFLTSEAILRAPKDLEEDKSNREKNNKYELQRQQQYFCH